MSITMLTQRGTIRRNHKVCKDFAGVSTDGDGSDVHFDSKGDGIRAYNAVLSRYGLRFYSSDHLGMSGDDGRIAIDICLGGPHRMAYGTNEGGVCYVGHAIVMWNYVESSGRYEFTGYIT
jgi:hypothetical protein